MIAVLSRPASRTALLASTICLVLVALGAFLGAWRPVEQSDHLILPLLAVGGFIIAALCRIDNGAWRLEAPFLGATFFAYGPFWTLLTAGIGWVVGSFLRTGGLLPRGDWQGAASTAAAALGAWLIGAAVALPGWAVAAGFVFIWTAVQLVLHVLRFGSMVQIVAPLLLAASLGGLASIHAGLLAMAGVLPLALLASIAVYGSKSEAGRRETLQALALMLQRAHPYTHSHLERVASLAERTALKLGLPAERAMLIHEAARLHDIGKIAIDEQILDKPGALQPDEYEHVKLHAPFGAAILEEIEELRLIADWIRHHHERPDGSGYPHGLAGDDIPLEARIIAVADAFDAMTGGFDGGDKRPYREPVSPDEAIREMRRCAGTQFDCGVVAAFDQALREESRV